MELNLIWDREYRENLLAAEVQIGNVDLRFESIPASTVFDRGQVVTLHRPKKNDPIHVGGKTFSRKVTIDRMAQLACMQSFLEFSREDLYRELDSVEGIQLRYGDAYDDLNSAYIKFILHCWLSGIPLQHRKKLAGYWYIVESMPTQFDDRFFRIARDE